MERLYCFMPVAMLGMNLASFASGLAEGRIKINAARFAVMYAFTVLPAIRGDYYPFIGVLSMPPSA